MTIVVLAAAAALRFHVILVNLEVVLKIETGCWNFAAEPIDKTAIVVRGGGVVELEVEHEVETGFVGLVAESTDKMTTVTAVWRWRR